MNTRSNQLPQACDDIFVSFVLSDGRNEWWRATVEDIHILTKGGPVLATASILYESAFSYPAERANVSFLRQNLVRSDDVSPGASSEPSSWAHPEEEEPSGGSSENEVELSHKRKKRRNTTKYPVAAASTSEDGTTVAIHHQVQRLEDEAGQHSRSTEQMWHSVSQRLNALDRGMAELRACDHSSLIRERVKALRVTVKLGIIETIQRPLRKSIVRFNTTRFGGLLCRDKVSVSHPCDWDLFSIVAQDVFKNAAAQNVIFLPSYMATQHDAHDIEESSVIFQSAWSLLQWLGIWSECEKRSLLMQTFSSKQGPAMRLLGGLQWDMDEEKRPLNIFIGGSCIRTITEDAQCDQVRTSVHSSSAEWSNATNEFVNNFMIESMKTGMDLLNSDNVDEFDAISMTWSADSTLSKNKALTIAKVGEGVRVGMLHVVVPSCNVFSNALCSKLKSVLCTMHHANLS